MAKQFRRIGRFLATHLFTGILTFLAMYGVANIGFVFPINPFEILLLYSWVLTLFILPIQAGIQIWSLLRFEPTPFLIVYYFQHDTTTNLPHRFLDPVESRIGLITIILLLIGGIVAWPIYSFYGAFLLLVRFGPILFTLEFVFLFIQGLAVGVAAIFVSYFIFASLAILFLQWRRRIR